MRESVAPTACAIRPLPQANVVDEVLLRRQHFTYRFNVLHGTLGPRRHRCDGKLFTRYAGGLQHPPRLGRQALQATDQQLPQPLGQTDYLGFSPVPQRPLPLTPDYEPLSDEVLHDVHQEERIALRALEDERRE